MEAEDAAAQQSGQDLLAPRADREGFRIGPRNVPEGDDRGIGQFLADHPRQQREVVILHQHDGRFCPGLAGHGPGELAIHRDILRPVARAEGRPHMGDVAQRPEAFVGQPVVIAGFFLGRKPNPANMVGGLVRRHGDTVVAVDHLAIGRAAAVGDPGAGAGAHDRFQRRDQSAGGALHLDAIAAPMVDVRLAIGHHDDVLAAQFAVEDGAQRLRRPGDLAFVACAGFRLQFADQALQVAGDRPELRRPRVRARLGLAQQAFAAQQGAHAGHPATPRQLGDDHRDQRHHRRQRHEEIEHVALGFLAAARDEAHVMHQHQLARRTQFARQRLDGDVQGTLGAGKQMIARLLPARKIGAADFSRQGAAGQRSGLVRGAVADCVKPLVLGDAGEEGADLGLLACRQLFLQRFLDGIGDQRGADVEVAHEPFQRQLVDQRRHRIGNASQHQHQWKYKAQRKSHVVILFVWRNSLCHARHAHPRTIRSGSPCRRRRLFLFGPQEKNGRKRVAPLPPETLLLWRSVCAARAQKHCNMWVSQYKRLSQASAIQSQNKTPKAM